jgi:TPP-dependent pyruvate/acetoin dehydrogenase alpha subunit
VRDPIDALRRAMEGAGLLDGDRYEEMVQVAANVLAESIAFSENSPLPDPATATNGVISLPFDARGPR